mmetsp:Transcript_28014/g.66594  ORF Transcript_28014/g.66594 Transcript_28014/m.66594 type:complete len:470 (+) Transcript_28014:23-1432(+)
MAAADFKAKGNELFRLDKFADAAEQYSKAIEADPTEGALYSNRSACYAALEQWPKCLEDATACLKLRPEWPKAYYRRALGLVMTGKAVEGRAMTAAGLAIDPENKELKELRKKCIEPTCRDFGNASMIDYRMDAPPSEDFKLVMKGRPPPKGAELNEKHFPQTQRTLMHVAVMMQHSKLVKDMMLRGGDILKEDRMGLTALHLNALIQHEETSKAFGERVKEQPMSSTHNATPQEMVEATSYCVQCPPVKIKVAKEGGGVEAMDGMAFLKQFGCWYQRTVQLTDEYLRCMFSSVLDEEGAELMADPRKNELTKLFKESKEEQELGLAFISKELGYGVFALKAFKEGDYVCCYGGVLENNNCLKDQARNPFIFTIMALDKLPFKTDATLYRSLGAYLNHSDSGNVTPEHIVAKGAPMAVFVANREIAAGEQISFDYKGRLHTLFCENNLKNFSPLEPLPPALLKPLQDAA